MCESSSFLNDFQRDDQVVVQVVKVNSSDSHPKIKAKVSISDGATTAISIIKDNVFKQMVNYFKLTFADRSQPAAG